MLTLKDYKESFQAVMQKMRLETFLKIIKAVSEILGQQRFNSELFCAVVAHTSAS